MDVDRLKELKPHETAIGFRVCSQPSALLGAVRNPVFETSPEATPPSEKVLASNDVTKKDGQNSCGMMSFEADGLEGQTWD